MPWARKNGGHPFPLILWPGRRDRGTVDRIFLSAARLEAPFAGDKFGEVCEVDLLEESLPAFGFCLMRMIN